MANRWAAQICVNLIDPHMRYNPYQSSSSWATPIIARCMHTSISRQREGDQMSGMYRLLLLLTLVLLSACGSPTVGNTPPTAVVVATPVATAAPLPTATAVVTAVPTAPTQAILSKNVDVGGRTLHIVCTGAGSPTVILDAGLGGSSADWSKVQDPAQQITQVCAYDRAGTGQSEPPASTPRTTQDIVDDLHTLLINADVAGPYVLVGHSSGGLDVLLYAHQYPKDVVGVVLVDSDHQEMDVRTEQIMPPEKPDDSEGVKGIRQYLAEAKDPNTNPEKIDFQASYAQLRAVTSLGDIPLVVIIAGVQDSFLPEELAPQITGLWREMQEDHTRLSSRGRLVVAEQSDHLIPENQPQIIVDAIQEVVTAAQQR